MITYNNLLENVKNKIPQFTVEYDRLVEDGSIDLESGNHIVFSYVFTPLLLKAIKQNDNNMITEMFDYLEKMSLSIDDRVVEVCDQSVLEVLNDEFDEATLLRYMGPKNKEGFEAIKTYMY